MRYCITCALVVCMSMVFAAQASESVANVSGDSSAEAITSNTSAGITQSGENADPTSREVRAKSDFSINVSWAPVHVPFPSARGINVNYVASGNWIFGIDYMSSNQAIKVFSFDLGELNEQSLTLQARRFYGNSFNWKMGIGQRKTEVKLGQSLFDLVNNSYSLTVSELRSNFFRFGIGNQWQFNKKYTLVVDWFTINIPFSGEVKTSASQYANSPSSKQDIENAENILKYYPSGSIVQFEVGLIF